jgi:hypothetical protein
LRLWGTEAAVHNVDYSQEGAAIELVDDVNHHRQSHGTQVGGLAEEWKGALDGPGLVVRLVEVAAALVIRHGPLAHFPEEGLEAGVGGAAEAAVLFKI